MKTKFIVLLFLTFSTIGFSQKQALKAASKAIKAGNIDVAGDALVEAEGQLDAADEKMKAQYYFFKGQVLATKAADSIDEIEKASEAYNRAIQIEKNSGNSKYTSEANLKLQTLRQSLIEKAIKDQNDQNYVGASKKLYVGYKMNKQDTTYLYYAAGNAVNGKDYGTALKYYLELKDLGFNGVTTQYFATNKESGEAEPFDSKQVRDLTVKSGTHIKPEDRLSNSKKGEIAKNIALIYINQGKDEEAVKALEDAKKENPNDAALMQAEADIYYKLGNVEKYRELMKDIVANDPENPDLLYNLGVSASRLGDNENAMEYYKKTLELKPDYANAQINIAALILGKEKSIVDEMNGLGTSSKDYKRYDTLKAQRMDLYREAVPYLEGALKSKPDNIEALRTLMNIYYQLDDPKADEVKGKLKAIEGGN